MYKYANVLSDCTGIMKVRTNKGGTDMKKGPITGTFIDEITFDIPSSNWKPGAVEKRP